MHLILTEKIDCWTQYVTGYYLYNATMFWITPTRICRIQGNGSLQISKVCIYI